MSDVAQVAEAPVEEAGQAPSEQEAVAIWKDSLPEDIRGHQSLETFTDVGALAKSYVHAQSMIGAEKLAVPGKWAEDDDWNAVYDKLGRPDGADAYELTFAGEDTDQEFVQWFRGASHDIGLNNRQAQKLGEMYNAYAEQHSAEAVDVEAQKAQVVADLKKEFGNAFDERLGRGNSFVDQFGEDGLTDLTLEGGIPLVNHPVFIKTLINAAGWIHQNVSEDKMVIDKDGGAMTPGEAQDEVNQMMRQDGPYWDRRHPQHDHYVKKVSELMQEVHPEEVPAA